VRVEGEWSSPLGPRARPPQGSYFRCIEFTIVPVIFGGENRISPVVRDANDRLLLLMPIVDLLWVRTDTAQRDCSVNYFWMNEMYSAAVLSRVCLPIGRYVDYAGETPPRAGRHWPYPHQVRWHQLHQPRSTRARSLLRGRDSDSITNCRPQDP